ncbi:peptidase inhibitor family I36 protein [Streptomyces clavuligerus]|uniref:peptidase inhibitor family I36 protein n=1 Tax=Streptomyces clavuligerus TaxID=1901 RepID=UPI0001851668|nr:peptidase inhibitor family I36 protein [Streptomyces clavuligerus]ANW22356.1 hypothetical protein BB341_28935 [Streptomyces clavuligerus]WDN57030.1 peptidase inhibitor family I36 protein [Streptomyces clavuligerus]
MRRLTVLAAALSIATPIAPAAAAPDPAPRAIVSFPGSDCPTQSLCLYRDANYTGGGIALQGGNSISNLGDYGFNDVMSSWSNDTFRYCMWFPHIGMTGEGHRMNNTYRINLPANENDTASSVRC